MKYGHFAKTKKTEQNVSYIVYIGWLTFFFVDVLCVMRNEEEANQKLVADTACSRVKAVACSAVACVLPEG